MEIYHLPAIFNDANLKGYYRLNGNANDSSPSGINGTVTDATFADGKYNQGANFNGGTHKIDITNTTFKIATNLSVSAWIKTTQNAYGIVWCYKPFGARFDIAPTTVSFAIYTTADKIATSTTNTINNGNWYHIVGTYDGANARIYVNSTLEATTPATGNIDYTNSQYCKIGGDWTGTSNGFVGQIDELAIFNRVLTQAEITSIYTDGNSLNYLKHRGRNRLSFSGVSLG